MGDLHPLPQWKVTRKRLVGREAQAVMDEDGVLQITICDRLDDEKAAEHVRRILLDPGWRRLCALPGAAVSWLRRGLHGTGGHTLATGGVLATGAMLAMVVTGSAPLQQQAGGPPVTATRSQPDVDVDPLGLAPLRPLFVHPVRVPAATKGRSVHGSRPGVPGPLVSALASTGVPVAGSHPLKPTRTMVVTSARSALPSAVPVPSHPVRCVLRVMLRGGNLVTVTLCLH